MNHEVGDANGRIAFSRYKKAQNEIAVFQLIEHRLDTLFVRKQR